jgi:alpha-beta hydrolase superfamily lysophospholipase
VNTVTEIQSVDGLQLKGQTWTPDSGIKATVALVHGLGEHCGRYAHVAKVLNSAGFAVVALDLRGHGKSGGKRGHTPSYDLLMCDIHKLLEHAASLSSDIPVFLYGHSLGGNLVIHYALKKKPDLAGIIASAPLLRLAFEPPIWQQNLLRTLQRMNISTGMPNGLNTQFLSRDPDVVKAYKNDPLTHNRITPSLAVSMIEAGQWNLKHASGFPLPLLLLHGSDDRITSPEATTEFANMASNSCTLQLFNGLYHELHNEPEKEDVIGVVQEWIFDQLTH